MPAKWSPDNPDDIIRDYDSGKSLGKIASERGVDSRAVRGLLKRHGVEIRNPRALWIPDDPDAIIRDYEAGAPTTEIAAKYGVTSSTIGRFIQRSGGRYRPQKEANELAFKVRVDDPEELVEAYLGGASIADIVRSSGTSRGVVKRILKEAGAINYDHWIKNPGKRWKTVPRMSLAKIAKRPKAPSLESRIKAAKTRESRGKFHTKSERDLAAILADYGLASVPQMAIGTYNVDLGIPSEMIAVDVHGSAHEYSDPRASVTRARYLVDRGFTPVVVWVKRGQRIRVEAADYIASLAKALRADPSLRGKHRVIWCDGEECPGCCGDIENVALVPLRRRSHNGRSVYLRPGDETVFTA